MVTNKNNHPKANKSHQKHRQNMASEKKVVLITGGKLSFFLDCQLP